MSAIEGVGLGLRSAHLEYILAHKPDVPWFELLSDNWLNASGIDGFLLDKVLEHYPISLHGVGMNVGGTEALNVDYLHALKQLAKRCGSQHVSDHLCFSAVAGQQLHDLAPLPYTEEALQHCVTRIHKIQDVLQMPLIIENISAYVSYKHQTLSEAHMFNELAQQTGCKILLDVNNLYVNQKNIGTDALLTIAQIKPEHVSEIHLGGYTDKGHFLLDAHNNLVSQPVWDLYKVAISKFKNVPTLIEWDHDLPDFSSLLMEQQKAQIIMSETCENTFYA